MILYSKLRKQMKIYTYVCKKNVFSVFFYQKCYMPLLARPVPGHPGTGVDLGLKISLIGSVASKYFNKNHTFKNTSVAFIMRKE